MPARSENACAKTGLGRSLVIPPQSVMMLKTCLAAAVQLIKPPIVFDQIIFATPLGRKCCTNNHLKSLVVSSNIPPHLWQDIVLEEAQGGKYVLADAGRFLTTLLLVINCSMPLSNEQLVLQSQHLTNSPANQHHQTPT